MQKLEWKKYLAECLGTAALVFMGCGSAVLWIKDATNPQYALPVALVFGLVLTSMAYTVGNVSGCHINPAVSLAAFINKKLSALDFTAYVIAQCVGGTVGALFIFLMASLGARTAVVNVTYGANDIGNAGGLAGAILFEIILTFIFVSVVLNATSDEKNHAAAPIAVGFALTLVHLIGIPLTGTSVNPARSIGPAILAGGDYLKHLWVFIVSPLAGGALAGVVYKAFYKNKG